MSPVASALGFLSGAFLSPAFLGFLAAIPVVILLYLLKLRRTEVIISSTMLWLRSLEDMSANAPFQKLKRNLLLFLQILALLLAVAALSRPYLESEGAPGSRACILIDRSASMSAAEENGTRLEMAKAMATDVVNRAVKGDKLMLISFADRSEVPCELTDDLSRLREAIASIEPTDARTSIKEAVQIVRSLSPDNPDVPSVVSDLEVILISDGGIEDEESLGELTSRLRYLKVGRTSDNAGITAFSVRSPPEGRGERQALVTVFNGGGTTLETALSLYAGEGLLSVSEIEVGPGASEDFIYSLPDLGVETMRAELDVTDALASDNAAWTTLSPSEKIRVLLVASDDSTGAYFIRRALSLDKRVELGFATTSNYRFMEPGDYDLIVFDGWAPQTLPEKGGMLFINAVPPARGVSRAGEISRPPALAADPDHPLTRFVNPTNLTVMKAMKLVAREGSVELISSREGPLLLDASEGERRIVVVAFDLAQSDWPLRLSFPVFVQNLLNWAPGESAEIKTTLKTGSPLPLFEPGAESAVVTKPDGGAEKVVLDPTRPVYFGDTDMAGVYVADYGGRLESFAVSLLDKNESDLGPADSISVGRGERAATSAKLTRNREYWRALLLIALMVLAVEWIIYARRAWI